MALYNLLSQYVDLCEIENIVDLCEMENISSIENIRKKEWNEERKTKN